MPAQPPPDSLPLQEARSRPEAQSRLEAQSPREARSRPEPQSPPAAQAQSPPEIQPFPRPLRQCRTGLLLPLAGESVAAGFPSPADDYVETGIDLNEQLIARPSSTFFLRVSGDSMVEAGIHHGDLLIVDRSVEPRPGRIVVAVLEGAFTLKRLVLHRGRLRLEAAHPAYPPLALGEGDDTLLWGVAIHVIHPL